MSDPIEGQENLQMSFLDHLDELRQRLIYSVITVSIAFAICYGFSNYIYRFLEKPVVAQLQKIQRNQQAKGGQISAETLKDGDIVQYTFTQETAIDGVKVPLGTSVPVKKAVRENKAILVTAYPWAVGKTLIPIETSIDKIIKDGESEIIYDDESKQLIVSGVTSSFMVLLKVALYAGIALSIPFLFYQIWAFISPGLYKHEKKYIAPVLIMSSIFFILGASFAYKVAFPAACDYLLGLAAESGFRTLLNAEDYLDLIIMIMIGLGIVFQIPTIAFVLGRVGLLTPRMMWKAWRYAIVIIAIIAAVLTPTPDAFNMMMFAAPMMGLYFISIGIVWIFGKPRKTDDEMTALAKNE